MTHTARSIIITQLRELLQLTNTEIAVSRTRIAQARTEAVHRELVQNGNKAHARAQDIESELRNLGGVPDLLSPVFGRVAAIVKATAEQVVPLDEALLSDLQLEHQLLDRARYIKVLSETAEEPRVRRLAERLIVAHSATVEWLTVVLAEEALGGPAALRATPLQWVAGTATRVVNLPVRVTTVTVNRALDDVQQNVEEVRKQLTTFAGKAAVFTGAAREVFDAGRDATLTRAELVADREGADDTAQTVHELRREAGALTESELPIKGYSSLNVGETVEAVKNLKKPEDLRAVINFEEAHKNRQGIVSAAQTRLAGIAKDAAGIA